MCRFASAVRGVGRRAEFQVPYRAVARLRHRELLRADGDRRVLSRRRTAGAGLPLHPRTAPPRPTTRSSTGSSPRARTAKRQCRVSATLNLTIAARGTTWLEISRGSKYGRLLTRATCRRGRTLRFRGSRLWGRFGAAGDLTITQDGRPVCKAHTTGSSSCVDALSAPRRPRLRRR